MDLSKLPKLSQKQDAAAPPPTSTNLPVAPLAATHYTPVETGSAGQIWLSCIVGVILMVIGRSFLMFLIAKLTGHPFHTGVIWQSGELAGQEVEYFQLQGYTAYSDAAIFFFGLLMMLEAIVLAVVTRNTPRNRKLLAIALLLTLLATAFNLMVAVMLLQISVLPLYSGLAVAYGGFIAIHEWQLLRRFQRELRA